MKTLTCILAAAALAGCVHPTSPGQTVFALESSYEAALTAAVAYKHLPMCAAQVTPVCHSPAVVNKLVAADDRAHDALMGAEAIVRAHGTQAQVTAAVALAQVAIADFRGLTK